MPDKTYRILSAKEYYEGEIRDKMYDGWETLPLLPYMENTPTCTTGFCVNVYGEEKQTFLGFGAAITEGAAYQYAQMSAENREKSLELLFGKTGLNYSLARLAVGSCDFSVDEYSCVEDSDTTLATFSIDRDRKYLIPFIRDIIRKREGDITFFASPWSPPAFMKTNGKLINGGALKPEYYGLYAEYIAKFIEAYREEGICISYLTVQNEPDAPQSWESCRYTAAEEAALATVLSDTFKAHGLQVGLLCWDHNKGNLYRRAREVYEATGDRVCGAAFHWYDGSHFDECGLLKDKYPDKLLIETEFCSGFKSYYADYRTEIIGNLQNGVNGIIEWCLMADQNGAPFHNRNFGCVTTVYYDTEEKTVKTRGIYGKMCLFSNKITRGSRILYTSSFDYRVKILAARTPQGRIIAVIHNEFDSKQRVNFRIGNRMLPLLLFPKGTVRLELEEE